MAAMAVASAMHQAAAQKASTISHCVRRNAELFTDEVLDMLPLLLSAAGGYPGSFLEIGANTGTDGSQTYLLERCFGWKGLLVEAQPRTFAKLEQSPRTSTKIWAAACSNGRMIRMLNVSVQGAASPDFGNIKAVIGRLERRFGKMGTVEVPCREMQAMMQENGFATLDFASIDVQGAEDAVLKTVDPRRFQVVLVELEGLDSRSQTRLVAVRKLLEGAGLVPVLLPVPWYRYKGSGYNELYIQPTLRNASELRPSQMYGRQRSCASRHTALERFRCFAEYHSSRTRETRIGEVLSALEPVLGAG